MLMMGDVDLGLNIPTPYPLSVAKKLFMVIGDIYIGPIP